MANERQLVPILRDGIEIVKVIFFKELREHLGQRHRDWENDCALQVTAAVVNEVFGVRNQEAACVEFMGRHREDIDCALSSVATELPKLRIPLTDALRTMVLCDYQEGHDTSTVLQRAQASGILLVERDMPLPNQFIDLVRRLGAAMGLLQTTSG